MTWKNDIFNIILPYYIAFVKDSDISSTSFEYYLFSASQQNMESSGISNRLELSLHQISERNCRGLSLCVVLMENDFFCRPIKHVFTTTWFARGHQGLCRLLDLFFNLRHVVVFPCVVHNDETRTKISWIVLKHLQIFKRSHFWSSEHTPSYLSPDNLLIFVCWCEILCTSLFKMSTPLAISHIFILSSPHLDGPSKNLETTHKLFYSIK